MAEAARGSDTIADWYASVRPLCVARLREAHDPQTGLFSRQLRDGRWGDTGEAEAITSTAICLISLSRAGIDPEEVGAPSRRSLDATTAFLPKHPGATGLVLWARAVSGRNTNGTFSEAEIRRLLPTLTTMETAWLLSGLLHAAQRTEEPSAAVSTDLALSELLSRQGAHGLFAHAGHGAPIGDRIRRNVANFADQIYAVQALAFAAIALGRPEALGAARRCADALVARRGPLHQWWWHYHPGSGTVTRRYPVYSVHQHAMAPMAFMALAAAGARRYSDLAWPGLDWLRMNELGIAMQDGDADTIWRDIEVDESGIGKRIRDARETFGLAGETGSPVLRLNRETRPYEWGWCLLAGAMLTRPPPDGHLA